MKYFVLIINKIYLYQSYQSARYSTQGKYGYTINVFIRVKQKNHTCLCLMKQMRKKGANGTISFLQYYIENFLDTVVKTLYLFSDNCTGQNKSISLVQYLSFLTASGKFEKSFITIQNEAIRFCLATETSLK